MPVKAQKGTLYIVATPIGNLADLSPRAQALLASVDVIAAEDTRTSQKLLKAHDCKTPLIAYHEHNEQAQTEAILARLQAGESVALISDAGTPLINDPGYTVVREAHAAGIPVSPIPGPCALIAALSASGLPTDKFYFAGFLPPKAAARQKRLAELSNYPATLVFYESPHRIVGTVTDLTEILGKTRLCSISRELTKVYETVITEKLENQLKKIIAGEIPAKGEFVVVVEGAPKKMPFSQEEAQLRAILPPLLAELPPKKAAKVAAMLTGQAKNEIYKLILTF